MRIPSVRLLVEHTSGAMQDFLKLTVWKEAHALTLQIYALSKTFPPHERYGLTSQLRRSASSIPANLAEGCSRGSDADFARFVQIAAGSASETAYHLLLSRDLGYLDEATACRLDQHLTLLRRRLTRLLLRLRTSTPIANSY